ncbi:eukaryotic aspartyl protease family protein [Actinidia rufa]|uniref:Eukaryotic aspartyl protease family protein n=1 Tax=Actinidia rufa TaxID=165716 RepID=A0A7J0EME7_9ERIC|nr:eukaryotic aspartyl protease family protein [Actinidia rufa]
MALIVSLPIGTPPQTQQMVLDTGSQLSWIQCNEKVKPPPTTSFDPSLSSSFSASPVTTQSASHEFPIYPPNVLRSKPPLPLLVLLRGRDLGRGQFSPRKIHFFEYPKYPSFDSSQRMPNFDPLAFTLPMVGLRLGTRKLNVSTSVFRPNAGGAGQTIIDSGSEFTYLVDEAYSKGALDMCFDGDALAIGRSIGDLVFEFEKGVELAIEKERVLADVGGGVHCLGIGRSDLLGIASNIIGNVHQQNYWVEYDLTNRRVGFGKADCSRSVL